MHLLIPFASSLPDACAAVLADLSLPNLSRLLTVLSASARDDGDEYSFSPPHERALAAAHGWPVAEDGCLPFAARAAAADGLSVGDRAWGLVTPSHWHVGRDNVSLLDPAALALTDEESRAAFDAVSGLFASEGFEVAWGAPMRWYVAHDSLAGLPTASLDRVIGRNVELWMRTGGNPQGRLIRRLQSEVQLLMYPHPINDGREQAGRPTLNSFWLSGCGRLPNTRTADGHAAEPVEVADDLRAPLLAEDWAGWAEAWKALDRGALAACRAEAEGGSGGGGAVSLTLCGERSTQRFDSAPRSLWQKIGRRWSASDPAGLLQAL